MVEWKKKSRRKATGGINHSVNRKTKSLSEKGGTFSKTVVSDKDQKHKVKTKGGGEKLKITKITTVTIAQGNKNIKAKILDVVSNSADKHFVRQKVITKGAVVKAELEGKEVKVKITSRPGQAGTISGVLVK
jgi:small subunit ribosomal protein S8e